MTPRQGKSPPSRSALRAAGRKAFAGFELRVLARTPSTQDVVRAAARAGAPEGYCCVAEEQTAGRGRLGRSWLAPPGTALLASILLRPGGDILPGVTLAAGLAVVDAIEVATGLTPRLRWPNDVCVDGVKLAGILAETEVSEAVARPGVILGIGVNLRVESLPEGIVATSLHKLVESPPSWEALLLELLPALSRALRTIEEGGRASLCERWRRKSTGLGSTVRRDGPEGRIAGTALDIDDEGALLVRTPGGELLRLIAAP